LSKPGQGNIRADALDALDRNQRTLLAGFAELMSRGTGDDGDDLLQSAMARWLASDVPIQGPDQTCNFLRGAISSIRFNTFRKKRTVERIEGRRAHKLEHEADEPLDRAADPTAATDGPLYIQQVYDLCEDEDVKLLLLTLLGGQATPDEVKAELGWNDTKYATVLKRKRRLVIRLMLEGKLT